MGILVEAGTRLGPFFAARDVTIWYGAPIVAQDWLYADGTPCLPRDFISAKDMRAMMDDIRKITDTDASLSSAFCTKRMTLEV